MSGQKTVSELLTHLYVLLPVLDNQKHCWGRVLVGYAKRRPRANRHALVATQNDEKSRPALVSPPTATRWPAFAIAAGIAVLRLIAEGYGYEITGADVLSAYQHTMTAAAQQGSVESTRKRIGELITTESASGRFVAKILEAHT